MKKAGNYGAMSATSRVGRSFGTWLPKTSSEEEENINGNGVATDDIITSTRGCAGTLPALVLETSAVGHKGPREIGETNGGGGKAGDQDNDDENEEDSGGRRRDPSTLVLETTTVAPECQHKTGEMGGGRVDQNCLTEPVSAE